MFFWNCNNRLGVSLLGLRRIFFVGYMTPVNIFLILPLSLLYIYACFTARRYRFLLWFIILISNFFIVIATKWPGDAIYLVRNIFGTNISIVMYEYMMPWHYLSDPRNLIVVLGLPIVGFALIEAGGWCFREATPQMRRHTHRLASRV